MAGKRRKKFPDFELTASGLQARVIAATTTNNNHSHANHNSNDASSDKVRELEARAMIMSGIVVAGSTNNDKVRDQQY